MAYRIFGYVSCSLSSFHYLLFSPIIVFLLYLFYPSLVTFLCFSYFFERVDSLMSKAKSNITSTRETRIAKRCRGIKGAQWPWVAKKVRVIGGLKVITGARGLWLASRKAKVARELKVIGGVEEPRVARKVREMRETEKVNCTRIARKAKKKRTKRVSYVRYTKGTEVQGPTGSTGSTEPTRIARSTGFSAPTGAIRAVETEIIRATGATGVTGPNVTANNLVTGPTCQQTITEPELIAWGPNIIINGTAITHTSGSPTILLAPSQVYEVSYTLTLQNSSTQDTNFQAVMLLDGIRTSFFITPIPSQNIITISNTLFINSASSGNSFSLQGLSIERIPVNISKRGFSQVNVVKIK